MSGNVDECKPLHDGSLSPGEQHIVTAVTRILVDGHRFTKDDLRRILSGLAVEDHFNMDVQMMIRLLVDNLGVTRTEYETWFDSTGRASKKEIMRYFDKGVKETQPFAVAGRGLHSLLYQLNLSPSVHRMTQLNS